MKKIVTSTIVAAALTISANANVVEEDLTLDDFRYTYSTSKNKCVAMTYSLAEQVYQDYQNKNGTFLQHGRMNIVGTNIAGKDMFMLFYVNKKDCKKLEKNKESINTINAFAGLNIQIAKYCGIKADIKQTFEIAEYLAQSERDDFDTLKRSVNAVGLKCKI